MAVPDFDKKWLMKLISYREVLQWKAKSNPNIV